MVNISCDNRKTQDVYDCFISHACEDKDSFVRELALSLQDRGFKVWYDEFTLRLGNSLCNSIDRGIANSTCGIVVLSKNFFNKQWTNVCRLGGMKCNPNYNRKEQNKYRKILKQVQNDNKTK